MLKDFKPESIEDVILLVAAYRPGPMQFIPDIIDVKMEEKAVLCCPGIKRYLRFHLRISCLSGTVNEYFPCLCWIQPRKGGYCPKIYE